MLVSTLGNVPILKMSSVYNNAHIVCELQRILVTIVSELCNTANDARHVSNGAVLLLHCEKCCHYVVEMSYTNVSH